MVHPPIVAPWRGGGIRGRGLVVPPRTETPSFGWVPQCPGRDHQGPAPTTGQASHFCLAYPPWAPAGERSAARTPGARLGASRSLGAEDAAVDDGADPAAEVEHRDAGAPQGQQLLGVVGGAGDRAAGGGV